MHVGSHPRGRSPDLGLPDLVAPPVYVHLLQQGRDDLPAGLGVLGQQHLELLREILGDSGQEKKISVECVRHQERVRCPSDSQVSRAGSWFDVTGPGPAKLSYSLKQPKA